MDSGNQIDTAEELRREEHADFTIRLKDGREIKCHKILLARASPAFIMILRHDNVETTTNTMTLDAFEPETVEAFLEFIYQHFIGTAAQGSSSFHQIRFTLDLLKMSHMYDVECLLDKCTENLINVIDSDNAVDLWSVAEILSIGKLKDAVWKFLGQKGEKMLEVPGFSEMSKSPEMMTSLTTYLAKLTDQLKAKIPKINIRVFVYPPASPDGSPISDFSIEVGLGDSVKELRLLCQDKLNRLFPGRYQIVPGSFRNGLNDLNDIERTLMSYGLKDRSEVDCEAYKTEEV